MQDQRREANDLKQRADKLPVALVVRKNTGGLPIVRMIGRLSEPRHVASQIGRPPVFLRTTKATGSLSARCLRSFASLR